MFPRSMMLGAVLVLSHPLPPGAHDIYSHLLDTVGGSCCDSRDCRPARYRLRDGGVQMLVDGRWIAVPEDKIQYLALPGDTGESGGGHWCGSTTETDLSIVVTRCAFLPPRSASSELVRTDLVAREEPSIRDLTLLGDELDGFEQRSQAEARDLARLIEQIPLGDQP